MGKRSRLGQDRGVRKVLLAMAAVLLMAGCSGVTSGAPSVTAKSDGANTTIGAAAPVVCPSTVSTRRGKIQDSVSFEGLNRTYTVWVPQNYTGTTPLPVIVNYHGTGGTPDAIDAFSSNLSEKANARGYIVVAPQATANGTTTARWTVPGIGTEPDDVSFTNYMVDKIASEFCVNPKRVYATGFSSGGAMTTWVACSDRERIAAAVPGGGINLVDPACQRGPIPIFAYHGTADDIAPFNGLDGNPNPPGTTPLLVVQPNLVAFFGSVEQSAAAWAKGNGCQVDATGQAVFVDQQLAPDATLRVWQGCKAPTQLLLAKGGGHTFPGGTTRLSPTAVNGLGKTVTSVNMADLMLNWFDTSPQTAG